MPTLHVTNGDCAADLLRQFLTDPVVIAADVLHEGPAPAVDDETWLDLRSGMLSNGDDGRRQKIRAGLAAGDRALDEAGCYDGVVLWFEHDLFDQLQIVRTLVRLARSRDAAGRARLICIDRFPGVSRFIGLGQLDASQLSTLAGSASAVSADQFETAARVWDAFRDPDPSALNAIATRTSDQTADTLPFLRAALLRFLAEYPSTVNGLSATMSHSLEELEAGPLDAAVLFRRTQDREDRPFMGDLPFFDALRRLASRRRPLVAMTPGAPTGNGDLRGRRVALTDDGRAVLAGRLDAVAQNGIDEWRGGVHLHGIDRSPWRWDAARKTLVSLNELPAS